MEILREQIKSHEGLRLKPYRCPTGFLTIGHGRNLEAVGISVSEAEMLLRTDIARAVDGFCQLPIKVIKACGIVQKRVLVEMIFNMGLKGVMRFQKMLAAIEKGHFHVAAEEMLDSKWAEQCGSRVSLLAEQMREG